MKKILISLLLAGLFCGRAYCQEGSYTDSEGRIFLPAVNGKLKISRDINSGFSYEFPGESSQKCMETLLSVANILSSWRGVNPPAGANASIFSYVSERMAVSLTISVLMKDADTGEKVVSGYASSVYVGLNDIAAAIGNPVVDDIIATPVKKYEFHGHPVFWTNMGYVAVISPLGLSAFIPCSKEEYIKAVLEREEQVLAVKTEAANQEPEEKQADIKAEMDKSIKEMEETYQTLLKQDKKIAAEFKLGMEAMKKEIQSINSTPEAADPTKKELINAELNPSRKKIAALKAELAGMSESEKKMQAYLSEDLTAQYGEGSGLLSGSETRGGFALSRPNPLLVKKGVPLHIPQLLTIRWSLGNSSDGTPMGFNGDSRGFGHSDKIMCDLAKDEALWQRIFSLVK